MSSAMNQQPPNYPRTVDNCVESGYYVHTKKLGEGGFGVVRLATHLTTNQKVAIKMINKRKIAKDLYRVATEITALKVLRHKNIAKLLQVIENQEYIYLVMELCSGGELFDYIIQKNRLSDSEARKIIGSLVRVLAYIHEKGFAHRDIKPENILLDRDLNVKLIDFGLCASSDQNPDRSLDGLSTCCGSPAYVAPELLRGHKYSGPAADVWSTGVLLYTLLVGRLPFSDPNIAQLYKKIKIGIYEKPSFLTDSVRDLLSQMLCTDPAGRITIAEILRHPWICAAGAGGNLNYNLIDGSTLISESIRLEDESQINDQILYKCATLFADVDLATLKDNIQNGFGYQTATYWLVRDNPRNYKGIKEASQPTRSKSFSEVKKSPKVPQISTRAASPYPTKPRASTKNDENRDPAAVVATGYKRIPTTSATKRSPSAHQQTTMATFGKPKPPSQQQQQRPPITATPLPATSQYFQQLNRPTGVGFNTPRPSTTQGGGGPKASKRLFSMDESPAVSAANQHKSKKSLPPTAVPPLLSTVQQHAPIANQHLAQRLHMLADMPNNNGNTPAPSAMSSPFKNKSLEHAKSAWMAPPSSQSGHTNGGGTPGGGGDCTPKKSLIKRFLQSATPRKSASPRRFSTDDKNFQSSKTMMPTNYTNVYECMEKIVELLTMKQVNCNVKNFTIRCVLSSMNVIIVAFELEMVICRGTGRVWIDRKRLRGTSWDYVKICEELNKVQLVQN